MNHGVIAPEVGRWYRRLNGNLFEVVAIDEEHRTVELQHFDATIESLEMDVWREIDLEPVQAPEDWSGSVDIDLEDMPDPDPDPGSGWHDPMAFLERFD